VGTLYGSLPTSGAISLAIAFILAWTHEQHQPAAAYWVWFGAMGVVLSLRVLSYRAYRSAGDLRPGSSDLAAWLTRYRVGAAATAALWGLAGLLFFPAGHADLQAFTLLVLVGMAAGALSVNMTDYLTYRLFVVLTLAPVALLMVSRNETLQRPIGVLLALLVLFLFVTGRRNHRTMMDSIRLRFRNADLLADLAREKRRLAHEAETLIGSLLSSAPVALWALDPSGRVTFIGGSKLGCDNALRTPAVGDDYLASFAGQPQVAYHARRALNGETFIADLELHGQHYEVHYKPLHDDAGQRQGAVGVAVDVTERKRHERELDRRANYDELTGLPNRTLLMTQVEHAFDHARRNRDHVAVFFLDLDNFKAINDSMGHGAGDALLRETATRLQRLMRDSDIPGRLGGDEFLVISEKLKCPEDAEVIAHKITKAFQRPFQVDGREVYATTSVGIAVYPGDGDSAEQLLQSADTAMYQAKSQGKNVYRFFTGEMQRRAERHLVMETELRRAVDRGELSLRYQPKIDLADNTVHGVEALLRWQSPTLGPVSPEEFVAVAEVAGLMSSIGDWVMRTACETAAGWQTLRQRPVRLSINVSPHQFRATDLLANVTQALIATGLAPTLLELEITESVLVQDAPEMLDTFASLRELGVQLSLDDFGTGYSALSYLKTFPLQVLKIDKSFVRDLGEDRDDDSLVDAIIAMAQSLKLQIVAEGVETEAQLDYLRARGVHLVQGYYFSPPVDADTLAAMLTRETAEPATPPASTGAG
jgi:diguanylate cyclase (GGDEF)-like protein